MVKTVIIPFITIGLFFIGCKVGFEKLINQPIGYTGTKIRTNGYYYNVRPVGKNDDRPAIDVIFFYRNGVVYDSARIIDEDRSNIEQNYFSTMGKYELSERDKEAPYYWGIFFEQGNDLLIEGWDSSVGGKHPRILDRYKIISDSTLLIDDVIYKFRSFSPKPDSTNQFTHPTD